jgi:hypothetical protein
MLGVHLSLIAGFLGHRDKPDPLLDTAIILGTLAAFVAQRDSPDRSCGQLGVAIPVQPEMRLSSCMGMDSSRVIIRLRKSQDHTSLKPLARRWATREVSRWVA